MARVQTKQDFVDIVNSLRRRVTVLERQVVTPKLRDVNTTGLTNAQIDSIFFGGSQEPYDGVMATDVTNGKFIVRLGGTWEGIVEEEVTGAPSMTPTTYPQSSSSTWTISHNLGRLPVSVGVYDSSGNKRLAPINCPDLNTVVVYFNSPISGNAVIY